jgi:hypothetical protein
MWKSHVKNSLCWDFFCVNDNKDVDVKCLQTMICIIWYNNLILFGNAKTQEKIFTIITYNTTNGISTLKKHVNLDHYTIAKMLQLSRYATHKPLCFSGFTCRRQRNSLYQWTWNSNCKAVTTACHLVPYSLSAAPAFLLLEQEGDQWETMYLCNVLIACLMCAPFIWELSK